MTLKLNGDCLALTSFFVPSNNVSLQARRTVPLCSVIEQGMEGRSSMLSFSGIVATVTEEDLSSIVAGVLEELYEAWPQHLVNVRTA